MVSFIQLNPTEQAMIAITASAKHHIDKVLAESSAKYFRIALSRKGCSGYAYDMTVVSERDLHKFQEGGEQMMNVDGLDILIPSKDAEHLNGIELDWVKDGFSSRLAVSNPNVKNACGCGASVMF